MRMSEKHHEVPQEAERILLLLPSESVDGSVLSEVQLTYSD